MTIRERHHDYQITIPTVPVGGLSDLSIRLDTDAPFMVRVVKSRNLGPSGFRFQNADRVWLSNGFRTDMLAPQAAGDLWLPSHGAVVEPQGFYPTGGVITLAVNNTTNAPLTNVRVLFRGSKLYDERALSSATYPPRMSPLTFVYRQEVLALGVVDERRNMPLNIRTDSDFCLNWGVADPLDLSFPSPPAGTIEEVYCQLKDWTGRAYSNEPIHINDLFGQGVPTSYPTFTSTTTNSVNDPAVNQYPNRFMPGIYIPRNGALYLDVLRREVQSGMTSVDLYFRYGGVKVFPR